MKGKPKLRDYGLKGIDERPQIDLEAMPISAEERAAAIEYLIEWQVGNVRVQNFRHDLREFEWSQYGR